MFGTLALASQFLVFGSLCILQCVVIMQRIGECSDGAFFTIHQPKNRKEKTMRFLKVGLLIVTVTVLTACQTTTDGTSPARAGNDMRHIGVFMPQQSPAVDRIAGGKKENDYFMPLWRAYESGRVQGAQDTVTVYLYRNGDRPWSQTVAVDGYAKFAIPRRLIDSATSLCVEVPWEHIAHQTMAPNPRIMCADDVNAYMRSGKGRTEADAYGVVVIKPAG